MLALNEEIQNYKVSADMPDFIENYKSETTEEMFGVIVEEGGEQAIE